MPWGPMWTAIAVATGETVASTAINAIHTSIVGKRLEEALDETNTVLIEVRDDLKEVSKTAAANAVAVAGLKEATTANTAAVKEISDGVKAMQENGHESGSLTTTIVERMLSAPSKRSKNKKQRRSLSDEVAEAAEVVDRLGTIMEKVHEVEGN